MDELKSIYQCEIVQQSESWIRLTTGGRVDWRGNYPSSVEEAVEFALAGRYDSTVGKLECVCVCVRVHTHDEHTRIYTGLVRRVLEGKLDPEVFRNFVRKHKETGDISYRHNDAGGLPPRAAEAVEWIVARSFAGLSHRLFGEHGELEALDRQSLAKFDATCPLESQ